MLALIDHDPDIFLDEIQDQLEDQHGVIVSIATIWRTLKRLGITSKNVCCVCIHGEATLIPFDIQLSRAASERCEAARCEFTLQVGGEPVERFVCGDEAAVNVLMSYRENGWAQHGIRARKRTRFVRGTW
jgi:hypothetical protein